MPPTTTKNEPGSITIHIPNNKPIQDVIGHLMSECTYAACIESESVRTMMQRGIKSLLDFVGCHDVGGKMLTCINSVVTMHEPSAPISSYKYRSEGL